MKKVYQVEIIEGNSNIIYIPSDYNLSKQHSYISFGSLKTKAIIKKQPNELNIITISKNLCEIIHFPAHTSAIHLFSDNETIFLGPLIGIFTSGFTSISVRPLGDRSILFAKLLSVQHTVGVVAYLFGEQHINWDNGTIQGLFYHNGWKTIEVPFPNVIYDRIPNRKSENLSRIQRVKEKLQKDYLIPWYNPGFFNKLDVYERLLQEDSIADYLPETHPLTSFSIIERMLSNFGHVYIKPKNGSLGKGIYQILYDKKENNYYTRYKDAAEENRLLRFDSLEKLIPHITAKQNLSSLLVQQGIYLIRSEKKPIDFRIHTNKNKEGKWEVTAIAAKIAGSGSVTTHMNNGGMVKSLEELEDLELTPAMIRKKLTESALLISNAIEKQLEGIVGEIGFDLGIDKHGKVWLFEANSKPGRSIFKHPTMKKFDALTRKLSLEYGIYLMEQTIKKPEDIYR